MIGKQTNQKAQHLKENPIIKSEFGVNGTCVRWTVQNES